MMRMVYPRDQTMFGQTDGPHWASYQLVGISQVALVVKNPPANSGNMTDKVPSLGWEDPLEEGKATHSCILAWRIPWTEETGGLQSMGSERVGHDRATNTFFLFFFLIMHQATG